jgi:hypothetical protein
LISYFVNLPTIGEPPLLGTSQMPPLFVIANFVGIQNKPPMGALQKRIRLF